MHTLRALLAFAILATAPAHWLPAQSTASLTVVGPDGKETTLSAATLATLPRAEGRASAHEHEFTYSGTDLRDVLRAAGIRVDSLRGPQLRTVVTFVAADDYVAVIALSDLDPGIGARKVVLVDTEDGKPLAANYAPRRIIVLGDARPTRWVRQVVRIVITDVP